MKMAEEKKEAQIHMMEMLLDHMSKAPESQMETRLKDSVIKFKGERHTPAETYDFIVEIGKSPIVKVSEKGSFGDISSFVKVMCSLDEHYIRPTE